MRSSLLRSLLQLFLASLLTVSVPLPGCAQAPSGTVTRAHTFAAVGTGFQLDGKPFQIVSGELHYVRVPRELWRDRLHKAKAMGLNTITTYAFWNVHEPKPGVYDFAGQNDLAEFLREAQQEGLYVILRPGPYVCAEWELGGYPAWLLKDRSLVLRSTEPKYTAAVDRWLPRLAQEVRPLLLSNGGPILAIQLENEYGAFGDDRAYLEGLKASYARAGLGGGVLFTSNQASDLAKGSLPQLPSVVNFGSGGARHAVEALQAYRPDGVRMVGEYWAGWFDKWGEDHHITNGEKEAAELKYLLESGFSVSIYMFHGGTNFGWMNGADSHNGTDYHPDTTSYDYDAPLDEAGNPREKYKLFQQVIFNYEHKAKPPMPADRRAEVYPVAPFSRAASLWRNLPMPVTAKTPMSFEDLGQNYGYVLYRTYLDAGQGGTLDVQQLHDYAVIYVNQQPVGTIDRRLGEHTVSIPVQQAAGTLDILVENTGRVNYSHAIRGEYTGITGTATLAGKPFGTWEMFPLPMDDLRGVRFEPGPCTGPCFLQTTMRTAKAADTMGIPQADTWIDTRGLHKGQLWLGEHNLGRFWSVGPAFTLYAPGAWLSKAGTTVTVFDLAADHSVTLRTVHDPVFGPVTNQRESQ